MRFETNLIRHQTSKFLYDLSFTGPHDKDLCLYGSSYGVMCLANESDILICNPAIRDFRLLPQPPYHPWFTTDLWFVFYTKTIDCKVFRLTTLYESDLNHDPYEAFYEHHETTAKAVDHKIQIYDMSKDSWREIVFMWPKDFFDQPRRCCTSLDGNFYWLGYDYLTNVHMIGVLYTSEELFEQITFPDNIYSELLKADRSNLCVLKDSLALVLSYYGDEDTSFDIWVMDEYGVKESWIKKYSIGPFFGYHFTLGFRQNVEVLLTRWIDGWMNEWMLSYNLSTRDIKDYNKTGNSGIFGFEAEVFPYSDSLISVKRRVD